MKTKNKSKVISFNARPELYERIKSTPNYTSIINALVEKHFGCCPFCGHRIKVKKIENLDHEINK